MFLKYTNLKTLFIIILIINCWQSTVAYRTKTTSVNYTQRNPNIRCPGKNEIYVWPNCEHGGRLVKSNQIDCQDRYVCNVGLNEDCLEDDVCAYNAMCICGKCQKCEGPEKCPEFYMCPTKDGYPIYNMIKKLMQKRVTEFNNREIETENIN